ncbi:MAG: CCA tRNA nucleotidyltransferase [Bacilli bacterium]|nr:CCA tRNA nucleotidyltransferase [Bacilli bacterium]
MLTEALKLLKKINDHSYDAYIVGGFVRDYILGIESNDIDINTNATPKQIREIFEDSCLPSEDYGSVTVIYKGIRFEITTFRKEITYINNRKPVEIEYINNLYEDLIRRDFTINTLCMNKEGKIIDMLDGRKDIDNKIINTVGDASAKLEEDALRILRAVRFATILDFKLSDDVINGIKKTKELLHNLSYYRKKEELDKIFTSPNYKNGIKLLLELGLDKELEIPNLSKVLDSNTSSLIGIWSILDVTSKYPFNKNELELIRDINYAIKLDQLNPINLYKYGLYVNSVAGEIKKEDIKVITETYAKLSIHSKKDIDIDSETIMKILDKAPGKYLKEIYDDIEEAILYGKLVNNKEEICEYIRKKY